MLGILRAGHPHWIAHDKTWSSTGTWCRRAVQGLSHSWQGSGVRPSVWSAVSVTLPTRGICHGLQVRTLDRRGSRLDWASVHGGPSQQHGTGGSCCRGLTILTTGKRAGRRARLWPQARMPECRRPLKPVGNTWHREQALNSSADKAPCNSRQVGCRAPKGAPDPDRSRGRR